MTLTKRIKELALLVFLGTSILLNGQQTQYNYFYRVYFVDKGDHQPSNYPPSQLLSERALKRREKIGITVPDIRDIPVFSGYLEGISSLGLTLHSTSKWMNTGLFKTTLPIDPAIILTLPYVKDIKTVKTPSTKSSFTDKLDFPVYQEDTYPYDRPVTMINGSVLHTSGYNGTGMLIAVLDGGFYNTDIIPSLQHLRNRKGIKVTYDFITNNEFVYSYHNHGTAVLSVLAGIVDGQIRGTASGADYLLFRTEDVMTEFPVEEDFWVTAAEYADSAGADIISSSLGYFLFDDPALDYKYSDMDGNTAFVTIAADIAASKGILVVCSAGNERNKEWKRILAPSDGDSVISAGAVDGNNVISVFSSAGPAADGRIKPDNTAMGVNVPVQVTPTTVITSSGTSFSCPVLSGMAACLMQAVPAATNTGIIEALHYSADRYYYPDSLYGYGTPDMLKALDKLQDIHLIKPSTEFVTGPNPTKGDVDIIFREAPGTITIEIFNMCGVAIYRKQIPEYAGRSLRIEELNNKGQGIYFIRIKTDNGIFTHKIIKLRN